MMKAIPFVVCLLRIWPMPGNIADATAATLMLFAGPNLTPHFGHTSAAALIFAPQFLQTLVEEALKSVGDSKRIAIYE
jgi:hypothetical protein